MKRIVVGISGATGAPLAVSVLEFFRDLDPGSEPPGITHKMIIDATTPVPPEKHGEYSMQVMDPLEAPFKVELEKLKDIPVMPAIAHPDCLS